MFMAPISQQSSLYGGERVIISELPFSELSKVFPMCVEKERSDVWTIDIHTVHAEYRPYVLQQCPPPTEKKRAVFVSYLLLEWLPGRRNAVEGFQCEE